MLLFDFDKFIKDFNTSKKEISEVVGVGQTATSITCHSFNPLYDDYIVNFTDIYQIFYVKKIVERRLKF